VPVGIGEEGSATPTGIYRVVERGGRPQVPVSIRSERPGLVRWCRQGRTAASARGALRCRSRSLLVHGTNKPWGVGDRVYIEVHADRDPEPDYRELAQDLLAGRSGASTPEA